MCSQGNGHDKDVHQTAGQVPPPRIGRPNGGETPTRRYTFFYLFLFVTCSTLTLLLFFQFECLTFSKCPRKWYVLLQFQFLCISIQNVFQKCPNYSTSLWSTQEMATWQVGRKTIDLTKKTFIAPHFSGNLLTRLGRLREEEQSYQGGTGVRLVQADQRSCTLPAHGSKSPNGFRGIEPTNDYFLVSFPRLVWLTGRFSILTKIID